MMNNLGDGDDDDDDNGDDDTKMSHTGFCRTVTRCSQKHTHTHPQQVSLFTGQHDDYYSLRGSGKRSSSLSSSR